MVQMVQAVNENIQRISSREVSDMMGVSKHSDMLSKIDKLNEVLLNGKIRSVDYWKESSYKDSTGRSLREYQVSKKGCELLAHKSTGEKGVLFTIKYMERFEQMERQKNQQKALSPLDQLRLQYQVIEQHDKKLIEMKTDFQSFKDNAPLFNIECDEISKAVRKMGVLALGSKKSESYKDASIRNKVYSDIYNQLKREFGVSSYKAIKRCNLDKALEIVYNYELPLHLEEIISEKNSQLAFI